MVTLISVGSARGGDEVGDDCCCFLETIPRIEHDAIVRAEARSAADQMKAPGWKWRAVMTPSKGATSRVKSSMTRARSSRASASRIALWASAMPALACSIFASAVNVQSLLGIIFIVGIKVANTVLMTDYAQELRRHEGLSPTAAIRKAASVGVRPVTMTALAAFFAMVPMALARGSEANAPLGRAVLGGLLAGEPATLLVLPALYSLMVREPKPAHPVEPETAPAEPGAEAVG
jgi:hypothetical protein